MTPVTSKDPSEFPRSPQGFTCSTRVSSNEQKAQRLQILSQAEHVTLSAGNLAIIAEVPGPERRQTLHPEGMVCSGSAASTVGFNCTLLLVTPIGNVSIPREWARVPPTSYSHS